MTKVQMVARYAELKEARREIDKELEELTPYIDEELEKATQDGRNWVKKFGRIILTWIPKSKETISLKTLQATRPEVYAQLKSEGLITTSNYLERRTKEA